MEYFLERIARSLYSEFGNTLNRHCLVFPNRRAGLYFLKYLAARIGKPVWVPSIITINEVFTSLSSLQVAGNERLLFELYKVYRRLKNSPESFDEFYFWGDMLLNDFDDVDKYLVNASLLFRNVQDIKLIDQMFGGLTDEQIEIVRRFWVNFNPDRPTSDKSVFIGIWSILIDIYDSYKTSLKEQNLAYEGMIFREMAEYPENDFVSLINWDKVHFIGFNALNECEKRIMLRLKKAGKARFYWDYDKSYITDGNLNSAGLFMRDNLKIFGNNMPADWSYDTVLSSTSDTSRRRVIDTSSDVAQVKLISQLLSDIPDLTEESAHHTAVVLADENLLMPVLTSLPENIGDINITMGHPLKQTIVYTLVRHLMDLQKSSTNIDGVIRFNHKEVISILKHSLISDLISESDKAIITDITATNRIWIESDFFARSGFLERIFVKPSTPSLYSDYLKDILSHIATAGARSNDESEKNSVRQNVLNEFIYRIILSINRLEGIVNSTDISFSTETYLRIIDRMLRMQSVPFSGEPLSGIQIMGILETRALDFRNLIILSVNEGVLPAVTAGSSFIPFSLREAFGLPSINHQESIYAYHFYRLLQRAENVTFTYNSNSDGLRSGEMSRFLIQMKYEMAVKPGFTDLSFEIKSQRSISDRVERTGEHLMELRSRFPADSTTRLLTPTAINMWLSCRMKFYYRYINGLKEAQKVSKDIDPAMLGNILHEIMRSLYIDFTGKVMTTDLLRLISRNKKLIEKVTIDTINSRFNYGRESLIGGNELIVRDVLMVYINRIIAADITIAPFIVRDLETSYSFPVKVESDGSVIEVRTGGKVDRIDEAGGIVRIVDYKTGSVAESLSSVSDLFVDDRKKDPDGWLQTLLYCEAFLTDNQGNVVRPSVYKIKKLTGGTVSDMLKIKTESKNEFFVDDYSMIRDEYLDGLKGIIATIFSRNEPFVMTTDHRGKCSFCPYKVLCGR